MRAEVGAPSRWRGSRAGVPFFVSPMRLSGQLTRVAAAMAAGPRSRHARPFFMPVVGALGFLAMLSACRGDVLTAPRGLGTTPPDLTLTGGVGTQIFPNAPVGEFQAFGVATGLNAGGQVTGSGFLTSSLFDFKPFRWSASTGVQVITGCCDTMWGNDINDAGVVVGVAQTNAITGNRGFVASGSTTTPLSILPGGDPEQSAGAVAINNAGQIVGASIAPGFVTHAVLWSASGVIQDLGTLGGSNSAAIDINASGQVIGSSQITGDAATHFFLWSSGSGMQDLNTTVDRRRSRASSRSTTPARSSAPTQPAGNRTPSSTRQAPGCGTSARSAARRARRLGSTTRATSSAAAPSPTDRRTRSSGPRPKGWKTSPRCPACPRCGGSTTTCRPSPAHSRRRHFHAPVRCDRGSCSCRSRSRTHRRPRFSRWSAVVSPVCSTAAARSTTSPGSPMRGISDKFPGGSATGANVTVTYPHAGQRTVTLTVTDAQGLKNSVSKTFTVTDFPIASFTIQCTGLTCIFDSSASTSDALPLEPTWSFGDGQTAFNVVAPSHTFAQPGTYSVTLQVLDSKSPGRFAFLTKQVTVGAARRKQRRWPRSPTSCAGQSFPHHARSTRAVRAYDVEHRVVPLGAGATAATKRSRRPTVRNHVGGGRHVQRHAAP